MNLDEMRRLDALKTYKELEEAKAEIKRLQMTIKELGFVNEYLREKCLTLEYGRTNK